MGQVGPGVQLKASPVLGEQLIMETDVGGEVNDLCTAERCLQQRAYT